MTRSLLQPLVLAVICVAIATAMRFAPVQADCPAICAQLNSSAPVCSTEPRWEFDIYNPRVWAYYDIGGGKLGVASQGPGDLTYGLTLQDDWNVTGPVSGAGVDLTARLAVRLGADPPDHVGELVAVLQDGVTSADSVTVWATNGWTDTLSVALHVQAGVPFRMVHRLQLTAGGSYSQNSISGQILFVGLPAGAQIESCQGISLVAARPATWGSVKARYR